MGLDQYAKLKGQKLNFDKIFSDDSNPKEDGFVWRKHARLQVFMNRQWIKQNEHKYKKLLEGKDKEEGFNMSHLGFNAGDIVYMTEEVVKALETDALPLEERMNAFAYGIKLTNHSQKLLASSEKKIESILAQYDNEE